MARRQRRSPGCTGSGSASPCAKPAFLPHSPPPPFAPRARFGGEGAADVALASRLEDGLNFDQLSLVVLHVLDELADGVVGAVDLVVFGGEGSEEEGGEGGG